MKNKGFSVVEIAIVLVIMGILSIIVIQSLSILSTAKVKKELAAISKLEAGLLNYVSAMSALPEYDGNKVKTDLMIRQHYINASDLDSAVHKNQKWEYHACGLSSTWYVADKSEVYFSQGDMLCLRIDSGFMNKELTCMIEDQNDDRDLFRGKGRTTNAADTIDNSSWQDCQQARGTVSYMYRIY
jgi:prepilin-type N-terminal cleavage/methylation domain-containing protein